MDYAFAVNAQLPVGVALALTVYEHIVQAAPAVRLDVVAVHHEVSFTRSSRPVYEQQAAVGQAVKLGIGKLSLVVASHLLLFAKLDGVRSYAAAVAQARVVVVERHMHVAVAVNHKADYVVRIAYVSLVFRAAERPLFAVNGALADHKIAVAVIESDELHVAVGHQRIVAEHGRIDRSAAETRRNGHEARAYAQAV